MAKYILICPKCLFVPEKRNAFEGSMCKYCEIKLLKTNVLEEERSLKLNQLIEFCKTRPDFNEDAFQLRHWTDMRKSVEAKGLNADKHIDPIIISCPICQGKLSTAATACPHCGQPMNQGKPVQAIQQAPVQPKREKNIPRCPTCNSTNIRKLDVIDRGLSFAVWGIFSSKIGKSMMCKDCGYKW